MKRFLRQIEDVMSPIPEEIVYCYGEWQNGYTDMGVKVEFHEGLPKSDKWTDGKRRLVIIDDLMSEVDSSVTRLFTKGSHHRNLSIIFIVQNLFSKNPEQRTISLNSHYLILFKNPRDATQIMHVGKQMFPGKSSYVQESYKDATSRPHGYLLIDFRQSTPDHLRLRSNIFPPDHQVVYVQK